MTRYRMSAQKDRGPISFITCTLRAFLYTVLQNRGAALTRVHLLRPQIIPQCQLKRTGALFLLLHAP